MVRIQDFYGVRPEPSAAGSIAAVPYDVVTSDGARSAIAENPRSFLRVSRADAELPNVPPHDPSVYQRAMENFSALIREGSLRQDKEPSMYIYRVMQDGDIYLGLCCCLDVEDYRNNTIRRHEETRYDKEADRTFHIEAVKAHTGPVVLLYRDNYGIHSLIESLIPPGAIPATEVRTAQGSVHQIFCITNPAQRELLKNRFLETGALYIADGHHRAKSAVNIVDRRIAAGLPADGEVSRFMGVLFASDRMKIHGYSRLIADTGTITPDALVARLRENFDIQNYGRADGVQFNIPPRRAQSDKFHIFHMYLDGSWYECRRPVDPRASPLESLDVTVLQKLVLEGILGITDPRGDSRLHYLGGARPIADIEDLVDGGMYRLAFAMQPVRVETVLASADQNGVMPPKSTWFEPKLLSGLVVHTFE